MIYWLMLRNNFISQYFFSIFQVKFAREPREPREFVSVSRQLDEKLDKTGYLLFKNA